MKVFKQLIPTFLGLFLFASVASAHVTVVPKQSTTGAWETYTVKVPVEKDVPTTKITIKAPAGVEIKSYQPVPGWKYSDEKDAKGLVKSFTFEATGEEIFRSVPTVYLCRKKSRQCNKSSLGCVSVL